MATSDRQSRTWMCTVVFLDIAGFTQQSVTRQINVKSRLEQLIACAVADIPEIDRVIVDTGDGAALCHLGDPEEALFIGVRLRESLRGGGGAGETAPKVRIGINLGPIRMTKTLTGQPNPLGDGINNAQRIMSFAEPDQILVSRSFYEMIACLSQGYAPLFTSRGVRKDKHGKEHEVYELLVAQEVGAATTRLTQAIAAQAPVAAPATSVPTGGLVVSEIETQRLAQELAAHIGPLASVLVKKAVSRAPDTTALYQMLAETLPEGAARQKFLAARGVQVTAKPATTAPPSAGRVELRAWDEAELKQAEQRLAAYLGPVAKVIVRKIAAQTTDRAHFYQLLADELGSDKERQEFLNTTLGR
ncbi:MAG TPA: adenylate/guanylate cyclase domain-containing protein [Burkholderiaceae bacterium]|nr:adenylate/guanylate cyclase domain-containing protein [Burkholderiaceae bacterium]